MKQPVPGDMVIVAPKGQLTGFMFSPALYIGRDIEVGEEELSGGGNYFVHVVLYRGNVFKVPADKHTVEVLDKKWIHT